MSEVLIGKRKRVNRLVNILGHAVFKANMYSLEDGEPSVWKSELGQDDPIPTEEWIAAPKRVKSNKPDGHVRAANPVVIVRRNNRQAHNQSIKMDIDKRIARRQHFLKANWKQIHPFVDSNLTCPEPETNSSTATSWSSENAKEEYSVMTSQPHWLKSVQMRSYQLEGVNWLIRSYGSGINVILGDEMGLGKTIQTIVYLGWMTYTQKIHGPHLIVVPLSVLTNWMVEFKRFLPQMRVLRLHSGDAGERDRLKKEIQEDLVNNYDVVVTTYEMVKNPSFSHTLVSSIYWRTLVLDEGHVVRNEETNIAQTVRKMHFEQAILLTGTPLQNNLHELWALLNFLQPDVFASSERFDACFDIKVDSKYRIDQTLLLKVHSMLKPFMLRRIKADVEKTVPPKVEKKILCPLTPVQAHWYKRFLLKDNSLLKQLELENCVEDETTTSRNSSTKRSNKATKSLTPAPEAMQWKKMQSLFMQLRKVCNHPFLFAEGDTTPGYTDESIVEASGKLQVLDRLLLKLRAAGHRVVLFSQFTRVLDILGDYLAFREFEFCRLDGSTNRVQRQVDINTFNAKDSPLFVFLLSTRAGGLGVNLQTADTVILFDSDWNPQADMQAMARCHRIGQTKVVHVYRLVTEGTIEERMIQRAEKKLYLDQMVNRDAISTNAALLTNPLETTGTKDKNMNPGAPVKFTEQVGECDNSELLSMLTFGAHEICMSSAGKEKLTDEEIDRIISRQDARLGTDKFDISTNSTAGKVINNGNYVNSQQYTAQNFNPIAQPLDTRNFQGQIFAKEKEGIGFRKCSSSMKNIDRELQDREMGLVTGSKRQSVARLMTVQDAYGNMNQVLRANDYTLERGEPSILWTELKSNGNSGSHAGACGLAKEEKKQNKVPRAGIDYDNESFCLVCWDGGDLICCDACPAAYHEACLTDAQLLPSRVGLWMCPHHKCTVCSRNTASAGGMLFRCSACPHSFCEDHLPTEDSGMEIIGRCRRMEKCGFVLPRQACYIYCGKECGEWINQTEKSTDIPAAASGASRESSAAAAPSPAPKSYVEPGVFTVDRILSHKGTLSSGGRKSVKFLVRWEGYGSAEDTWESWSSLSDNISLHNYLRKLGKSTLIPNAFK